MRHVPGKENIADSLSRLTNSKSSEELCSETEHYVRSVAEHATPQALSTREIEQTSEADEKLSDVRNCIQRGQWHKLQNKRYLLVRSELSIIGKLVLRGTRIVVPSSLREDVLRLAHKGHPGIVSMQASYQSMVARVRQRC